jgi:hypothetical protein
MATLAFHEKNDWYDAGLVEISYHSRLGGQIIAAKTIDTSQLTPLCGLDIVKAGQFLHQAPAGKNEGSREDVSYLVESLNGIVYDLQPTWMGLLNHAPPGLANMYTFGTIFTPYPNQIIRKRTPLTWDYGVHYWVYQLTGIEYSQWNRDALLVFCEMHQRVVDYTVLLRAQLWNNPCRADVVRTIHFYLESFEIQTLPFFDNFIRASTLRRCLLIHTNKKKRRRTYLCAWRRSYKKKKENAPINALHAAIFRQEVVQQMLQSVK